MLEIFITYFLGILFSFLTTYKYVHMLQLESYQNGMYFKWVKNNYLNKESFMKKEILYPVGSCAVIGIVAILLYLLKFIGIAKFITLASCGVTSIYTIYTYLKAPKKKPLVITQRVKRLFITIAVTIILIAFVCSYIITFINIVFVAMVVFAPVVVYLANCISIPIERRINNGFLNDAKKILNRRSDLIKIGITGSFGKTSTKFILNEILNVKFNTLCSPASYNTPMGLTRVVREMLQDEHEVFIAEMGARYVGDIKELCDLVHPKYGIISSIGKQHLETFKSFENIISTKYDLIRSLPDNGIGYLPDDKGVCLAKYEEKDGKNKKLFSLTDKNAYVYAENITVSKKGSSFDLIIDGDKVNVTTCLLGKHNIQNILACCGVAYDLGMTLEEIAKGIANIKPIEHRLQLISTPNGVTVIDDAFNANPQGTKMAIEVLKYFDGQKIIVTPGLVELGDETEKLNKEFGADIAKVCDVAVLVRSPFTPFIKQGLIDAGFDVGAIVEFDNLEEVTRFIGVYAKAEDVVLFENDLPDNY